MNDTGPTNLIDEIQNYNAGLDNTSPQNIYKQYDVINSSLTHITQY